MNYHNFVRKARTHISTFVDIEAALDTAVNNPGDLPLLLRDERSQAAIYGVVGLIVALGGLSLIFSIRHKMRKKAIQMA